MGSPSKNMTSDFASEVAKCPKAPIYPKIGTSETKQDRRKFRRPNRKSGSPSKNMTSDFASEVATYLQNSHVSQNWDLGN